MMIKTGCRSLIIFVVEKNLDQFSIFNQKKYQRSESNGICAKKVLSNVFFLNRECYSHFTSITHNTNHNNQNITNQKNHRASIEKMNVFLV